ncbi:urease subunit gamma [Janibacter sp. GS2]|uniref:urease subunit gamma n=1 Tax=Janibacter sp. GS2 TaxID=3442646 RepID=UPI003EBA8367
MHLTPREEERLLMSSGAELARRRLARGAPLGAVEATALVCDEICEMAWDGMPLPDVIVRAREVVPAGALLPGVASATPAIEVEALFEHGTVLVHVDAPFGETDPLGPGAVLTAGTPVELAPERARTEVELHNTGDRPVWISSHLPLGQLNRAVTVSLPDPDGHRLDLPAGAALQIAPGERTTVPAVAIARSAS